MTTMCFYLIKLYLRIQKIKKIYKGVNPNLSEIFQESLLFYTVHTPY